MKVIRKDSFSFVIDFDFDEISFYKGLALFMIVTFFTKLHFERPENS